MITCPGAICTLLLYSSKYLVNPPMPEGSRIRSCRAIGKVGGWCKPPFVALLSVEAKNSASGHSTERRFSTCTSQGSPFHRILHAKSGGSQPPHGSLRNPHPQIHAGRFVSDPMKTARFSRSQNSIGILRTELSIAGASFRKWLCPARAVIITHHMPWVGGLSSTHAEP